MPVLIDTEDKQRFILPSTKDKDEEDQAWVVLDVSPIRTRDLSAAEKGAGEFQVGINMLVERIKEWNYKDTFDQAVEITKDSVGLLHIDDFNFLTQQIKTDEQLSDEQKKTSQPTSSPEQTIKVTTGA